MIMASIVIIITDFGLAVNPCITCNLQTQARAGRGHCAGMAETDQRAGTSTPQCHGTYRPGGKPPQLVAGGADKGAGRKLCHARLQNHLVEGAPGSCWKVEDRGQVRVKLQVITRAARPFDKEGR
jgi:hypothetical protein